MPAWKRYPYFFLSLGLHGLIAASLIWPASHQEADPAVLEVEWIERASVAHGSKGDPTYRGQGNSNQNAGGSSQFAKKSQALKAIQQGLKVGVNSDHIHDMNQGAGIFQGKFNSNPLEVKGSGAWVEQVSLQEGIELTAFWTAIQNRLNANIDYPDDFLRMRAKGPVQLDFKVNRQGQLVGDFFKVAGEDALLKLYVQASVIQVLKSPLPKNFWAQSKEDEIPITLHVHFEYLSYTDSILKNESLFANNEITLIRRGFISPLWWEKTERILTRYVPPVIPVPGGVYVDLIRLVEFVRNQDPNTPDPDEKLLQRVRMNRQFLESFIVSKKNST